MKELEAIKERAERATPGPWAAFEGNEADGVNCADGEQLTWDDHGGEVFKPANAEFIANARTDIPKLIAALEAVDAALVKQVEHFREFFGKDLESMRHIANSNRAFGADCALDAARQAITEALA